MKIPFYKRFQPAEQLELMESALIQGELSSRGVFTEKIQEHFKTRDRIRNMLLVTSASSALELALLTICPKPGAEFIIPPEFNSKTKAKSPVSFGIKGDFACCTEYKNVVTWKLPYQSEILAAAAL